MLGVIRQGRKGHHVPDHGRLRPRYKGVQGAREAPPLATPFCTEAAVAKSFLWPLAAVPGRQPEQTSWGTDSSVRGRHVLGPPEMMMG